MTDLDWLLARHPDIVVVEPQAGRPALVRRDQVLVGRDDLPAVSEAARRWVDAREERPGAYVLRLRAGADPCGLTADLGTYGRGHAVVPNHVLCAQPLWFSGPWGPPAPAAALPPPRGAGTHPVTVGVPDTGVTRHPWWAGRGWYAELNGAARDVPDGDGDGRLDPAAGHGTFVAGVVLRYAPTARLGPRRVLDGDGVGDEAALLDAIADLGASADLLCLSSGCHTFDDRPSPLLAAAMARLPAATVVVACAGNDASDRPFWPAALKRVVAVGALDGAGRAPAELSNHGWWVDACAPGTDVLSAFVSFDGEPRFAGYARWSGTSFAAPAVAGAIADRCATSGEDARTAAGLVLDPAAHGTVPGLGVPVGLAA